MQRNKPGTNNPINPLQKVAALTVKRDEDRIKKSGSKNLLPVRAVLTFQKSAHMEGQAKDKAGDPVTIRFTLAVREALMKLTTKFAEGGSADVSPLLTKVAHLQPLPVATDVSVEKSSRKGARGVAGANVEVSKHIGKPAKAKAGVSLGGKVSGKKQTSEKRKYAVKDMSVTATCSGETAWWEIRPPDGSLKASLDDARSYLSGEVFKRANTDLDACIVERQGKHAGSAVEIRGSVHVSMSNLVIDNVVLTDKLGEVVMVRELDPRLLEEGKPRYVEKAKEWASIESSSLRARIMKEIVRRHLGDQGLSVDGASVEICRSQD